jgi:phosphate-selective porin OprO/OprP
VQLDARHHVEEPRPEAIDTFTLRRVRPIFDGTIHGRFGFRIMPDFGGGDTTLQDAYVEWTASDAVELRAGKLKVPGGLERRQAATQTAFVERALPSALLPIRDVGVQLSGELADGRVDYAVGVFNGAVDGTSADSDIDDAKDLAARVWVSPWVGTPSALSGLSFGVGGSRGDQEGSPETPGLGGYRTAGLQTFFAYRSDGTAEGTTVADGARTRFAPQAAYFRGPLGLLAEHVTSRHEVRRGAAAAELEHSAFQVTAVWVLTGEDASLRWYTPESGFDRIDPGSGERGWGGLALTARYNAFAADEDSFPVFADPTTAETTVQREARGWAVGIDWTLQRQVRLLLDYEVTSFEPFGGGPARADEETLFARLQIAW